MNFELDTGLHNTDYEKGYMHNRLSIIENTIRFLQYHKVPYSHVKHEFGTLRIVFADEEDYLFYTLWLTEKKLIDAHLDPKKYLEYDRYGKLVTIDTPQHLRL